MKKDNWDIAGELAARKYPLPRPASMEAGALGYLATIAVMTVLVLFGALDIERSRLAIGAAMLLGFAVPHVIAYRQERRHEREKSRIYERLEAARKNNDAP